MGGELAGVIKQKENYDLMMYLGGIQEVSSIDYPGHLCSVIFFQGCNLKCKFCYNSNQLGFKNQTKLSKVLGEITKNLQVIDSIMLSGGEPLIHEDAILKIRKWSKNHGLKLGVETNGTFPTRLKRLLEKNIFDFIAMDVKSDFDQKNYTNITSCDRMYNQFLKSLKLLKNSQVPHEFRMTVTPTLHTINDIISISQKIKPSKLVLQRFKPGDNVLDKNLNEQIFPPNFVKKLKIWTKTQPNIEMRFWD